MPTQALRPCPHMGCRELTSRGPCPGHRRAEAKTTDAARGSASSRGYGKAHRAWRGAILIRDPFCVACLALDRVTASTVADHIVPRAWGGESTMENGQGLCERDHNMKRGHEAHGRMVRVVRGKGLVVVGVFRGKATA